MSVINKNLVSKLPKYIQSQNITWADFQPKKENSGIQFYSVIIEIKEKEITFHTETFAELLWILKEWKNNGFPTEFDGTV